MVLAVRLRVLHSPPDSSAETKALGSGALRSAEAAEQMRFFTYGVWMTREVQTPVIAFEVGGKKTFPAAAMKRDPTGPNLKVDLFSAKAVFALEVLDSSFLFLPSSKTV